MKSFSLPDFSLEDALPGVVAGVDEVGRGALAGPVVAAAVILPKHIDRTDIIDSKQLSKHAREKVYHRLSKHATYALGFATVEEIEEINILQATLLAMKRALGSLPKLPDFALIDGQHIPDVPSKALPVLQGDRRSLSIAAASIIAKVCRDRLMGFLGHRDTNFVSWRRNAGYGTKEHILAIQKYGITPQHRVSFLKKYI